MDNEHISSYVKYLKERKDIIKLEINSDAELDFESLSISGTVIVSEKLYPVGGGFDLGCGIGVYATELDKNSAVAILKKENCFSSDMPFKVREGSPFNVMTESGIITDVIFGGIEEGNHFIELRCCNEKVFIIIHSGICLSHKNMVAEIFIKMYKNHLPDMLESDNAYMLSISQNDKDTQKIIELSEKMNKIALENRRYIAEQIADRLKTNIVHSMDSSHEFITKIDNLIVHCNGSQEYHMFAGKKRALILSGANESNYIIPQLKNQSYINHGTKLKSYSKSGKRIYDAYDKNLLADLSEKDGNVLQLQPLCNCKKRGKKYVYKIFL